MRFYAGPDTTSIPATKRLLGQDRYFATVKNVILNGPGRIGKLLSREGGVPMTFDLSEATTALSTPEE